MKTKKYIKRQQLRELGFAQPDSEFVPFLEKVNQLVARRIDEDIQAEISANYDDALLTIYLGLIDKHGFDSPITQDWLERTLGGGLDSITVDQIEIALADLRRLGKQNSK
jgi:hypothetical protein